MILPRHYAQGVCTDVTVEREKSILKQGTIQHLYGRLSGRLRAGANDASLLVSHALSDLASPLCP